MTTSRDELVTWIWDILIKSYIYFLFFFYVWPKPLRDQLYPRFLRLHTLILMKSHFNENVVETSKHSLNRRLYSCALSKYHWTSSILRGPVTVSCLLRWGFTPEELYNSYNSTSHKSFRVSSFQRDLKREYLGIHCPRAGQVSPFLTMCLSGSS